MNYALCAYLFVRVTRGICFHLLYVNIFVASDSCVLDEWQKISKYKMDCHLVKIGENYIIRYYLLIKIFVFILTKAKLPAN